MATKKENKTVPVTLTPFHTRKLNLICDRTGLSKTAVIQRLIENFDLFADEEKKIK
jgi:hypothetical protein